MLVCYNFHMVTFLPTHLSIAEQQAIEALLARLMETHGRDIQKITLFGSKARGNDTAESDIDILVVITKNVWQTKHDMRTLGARVSLEQEVLFNLYVLPQKR